MSDKLLYAVPVPEDAQTNSRGEQQQQLSKLGILDQDVPAVTDVSPEPGQQLLQGWARGKYAPLIATMIEELFRASDLTVPYFVAGSDVSIDGYYSTENVTLQAEDPRYDRWQRFDGTLTREGSRRSHFRTVKTAPDPADNPFGSTTPVEISLSIRASDVRWYDDSTGSTESATVQRTVAGEHDDLDVYDATEPSFSNPWLVYDIPYKHEYPTDVTVWDDYDRDKEAVETTSSATVGSATVGSATVGTDEIFDSVWQRVFVTDHEWRGRPVLECDRLRLRPDEDNGRLLAYQWDASDDHWDIVQLGVSDWRLRTWDIRQVGLARVESRTTWENTSTGDTHRLDVAVRRGMDDALIVNPTNEPSVPSGLVDRLDPIASDADQDAGERAGIVKRSEVD